MRYKDINTLAQLRQFKAELKAKLKLKDSDKKSQNTIWNSVLNALTPAKIETPKSVPSAWDEGSANVINFLTTQTKKKFHWRKLGKYAITIGLLLTVPIAVKKWKSKIPSKA